MFIVFLQLYTLAPLKDKHSDTGILMLKVFP